jgi:hypothetical protein
MDAYFDLDKQKELVATIEVLEKFSRKKSDAQNDIYKILLIKVFCQRPTLLTNKLLNPRSDVNIFGRRQIFKKIIVAYGADSQDHVYRK